MPYTNKRMRWIYRLKTRSQQQISTIRIQIRFPLLLQAVHRKPVNTTKRTTQRVEGQTHIQSDLKDLTEGLVLPSLIIKGRRGDVSFLPWWDVRWRSRGGRMLLRWCRGRRLGFGRRCWRRRRGRRDRGRIRSARGRCLQFCQPLHANLGERQCAASIDYGRPRHVHGRHH